MRPPEEIDIHKDVLPVHLGTVTGPGLALLRMCLQLTETNPEDLNEDSNSVPGSSEQK